MFSGCWRLLLIVVFATAKIRKIRFERFHNTKCINELVAANPKLGQNWVILHDTDIFYNEKSSFLIRQLDDTTSDQTGPFVYGGHVLEVNKKNSNQTSTCEMFPKESAFNEYEEIECNPVSNSPIIYTTTVNPTPASCSNPSTSTRGASLLLIVGNSNAVIQKSKFLEEAIRNLPTPWQVVHVHLIATSFGLTAANMFCAVSAMFVYMHFKRRLIETALVLSEAAAEREKELKELEKQEEKERENERRHGSVKKNKAYNFTTTGPGATTMNSVEKVQILVKPSDIKKEEKPKEKEKTEGKEKKAKSK